MFGFREPPGGIESVVHELVRCSDRSMIRPSACIVESRDPSWQPFAERLRALDADVTCLDIDVTGRGVAGGAWSYARHLRAGRFDIIHVHGRGLKLRLLTRLSGAKRIIYHLHGLPLDWLDGHGGPDVPRRAGILADRLIACSRWTGDAITSRHGALATRMSVILNGVDTARFRRDAVPHAQIAEVRQKLGITERDVVAGFVGRMVNFKGVDHLLDAAADVLARRADVHFVLVGEGPMREQVVEKARRVSADRIHVLHHQPDIRPAMAMFDVLCVPSWLEGFGMVCAEAMALAIPVIASRTGGIPEVVEHDRSGVLVPPRDPRALAVAILDLLGSRERRHAMGAAGRARIEQHFEARDMTRAIERVYEDMMR